MAWPAYHFLSLPKHLLHGQAVTTPDVSTQFLEDIACQPLLDEQNDETNESIEGQFTEVDDSFMFLVLGLESWRLKVFCFLRRCVQSVAKDIVSNHGVGRLKSNPLLGSVVKWMEDQGIVQGGHLAPQLLTLKTSFSNPRPCLDCDSRFAIRNHLEISGWCRCETVRDAGVRDRCFNPAGTLEYFMLLKHHLASLEEYEDQFESGFRHSQAKGYYESFLAFFTCKAEVSQ